MGEWGSCHRTWIDLRGSSQNGQLRGIAQMRPCEGSGCLPCDRRAEGVPGVTLAARAAGHAVAVPEGAVVAEHATVLAVARFAGVLAAGTDAGAKVVAAVVHAVFDRLAEQDLLDPVVRHAERVGRLGLKRREPGTPSDCERRSAPDPHGHKVGHHPRRFEKCARNSDKAKNGPPKKK